MFTATIKKIYLKWFIFSCHIGCFYFLNQINDVFIFISILYNNSGQIAIWKDVKTIKSRDGTRQVCPLGLITILISILLIFMNDVIWFLQVNVEQLYNHFWHLILVYFSVVYNCFSGVSWIPIRRWFCTTNEEIVGLSADSWWYARKKNYTKQKKNKTKNRITRRSRSRNFIVDVHGMFLARQHS